MEAAGPPKPWQPTDRPQAVSFKVRITKVTFSEVYMLQQICSTGDKEPFRS
jgi:hypothetical protein